MNGAFRSYHMGENCHNNDHGQFLAGKAATVQWRAVAAAAALSILQNPGKAFGALPTVGSL